MENRRVYILCDSINSPVKIVGGLDLTHLTPFAGFESNAGSSLEANVLYPVSRHLG
jgi:hypothetical protein